MEHEETRQDADAKATDALIPIRTIELPEIDPDPNEPFMPRTLADDPVTSDGSASRGGVEMSKWRIHRLGADRLGSVAEPRGRDRASRKVRRARKKSRKARHARAEKKGKYVRVAVGMVMALAFVGVVYAGVTYSLEQWGGKTIPYVVGLAQGKAVEELEAKGFAVEVTTEPSDMVEGSVIAIDPDSGKRVEEGSAIHLTVGTSRHLPDVVGMSREDARIALEAQDATNLRFETRVTKDSEDKVLETQPGAGAVFASTDEITVVVSQLPKAPDVVGEDEATALAHLKREGITATSQFETASPEQRMQVIRTTPQAGENVTEAGMTLFVGDPLIAIPRLADYYDAKGPHIVEFLQGQGFTPKVGYRMQDGTGNIVTSFANAEGAVLSFVPQPWADAVPMGRVGYTNVLDDAAKIQGVRLSVPIAQGAYTTLGTNSLSVSEETANEVMGLCGFEGNYAVCTQDTIVLPKGASKTGHVFLCCSGEMGHLIWTVFIQGTSKNGGVYVSRISATTAPKSMYMALDLSQNGNSVCNYVAYKEEYAK